MKNLKNKKSKKCKVYTLALIINEKVSNMAVFTLHGLYTDFTQ